MSLGSFGEPPGASGRYIDCCSRRSASDLSALHCPSYIMPQFDAADQTSSFVHILRGVVAQAIQLAQPARKGEFGKFNTCVAGLNNPPVHSPTLRIHTNVRAPQQRSNTVLLS